MAQDNLGQSVFIFQVRDNSTNGPVAQKGGLFWTLFGWFLQMAQATSDFTVNATCGTTKSCV